MWPCRVEGGGEGVGRQAIGSAGDPACSLSESPAASRSNPPHPQLLRGEQAVLWVHPTWKGALYNCPYFPCLPQPWDTLPRFTSPRPGPPLTYPRTGDAPKLEVKWTTEPAQDGLGQLHSQAGPMVPPGTQDRGTETRVESLSLREGAASLGWRGWQAALGLASGLGCSGCSLRPRVPGVRGSRLRPAPSCPAGRSLPLGL